jgi:hypothetical protein
MSNFLIGSGNKRDKLKDQIGKGKLEEIEESKKMSGGSHYCYLSTSSHLVYGYMSSMPQLVA